MFSFPLPIQQMIVLGVTLLLIVLLLVEKIKPPFVFFGAVLVFMLAGIIGVGDLLDAFANESILSIFLLIFITAGIREHFNLIGWMDRLFGKAETGKGFMLRMTSGVTALSSFLNNTPIVALFMPYVYQWSVRHKVSPSKLLIPLSYAAIAGGMITVIGTSTNLVLNGLIESKNVAAPTFMAYLLPGLLVSIGGILFLYFFGYKLLPNRMDLIEAVSGKAREYLIDVRVVAHSSVIGKTILEANLRNLSGLYLFEIIRHGERLTPVDPNEKIQKGDALVFAGDTGKIIELLEREEDFAPPYTNGNSTGSGQIDLLETVIPFNSELIGHTLKERDFRQHFDAAVVAIHRNGERLRGKIGEIKLLAGDLLLVSPGKTFRQQIKERQDLYLVSVVREITRTHPLARKGFVIILAVLLLGLIFGKLNLFFSLLLLTAYMVASRLLSINKIKQQLDVNLLVVLVASLAFSTALIDSGAAQLLADTFMEVFKSLGNVGIVVGIYLITLILTSFVTHVAAVAIVFPIAYAIGANIPGMNMTAIFITIAFSASCSFHSPFSYQTNMMVYGPGGYKFKDFLKVGTPFTIIYSALALTFIIFYYGLL